MNKKKVIARYKQLRILITRAKEDAKRWGTDQKPLIMQGIGETSANDYFVYDAAYNKFVKQRMKAMSVAKLNKAEEEENDKKQTPPSFMELPPSRKEMLLIRIADALERIATALENEAKKEIRN